MEKSNIEIAFAVALKVFFFFQYFWDQGLSLIQNCLNEEDDKFSKL